jgi:hypothetical protein
MTFRTIAVAGLLALALIVPAQAMSVKAFEAKPASEQGPIVTDFIEKMTADIGKTDPKLMQDIRDWFSRKRDGWPTSEGLEKLSAELIALDEVAKEGKADLTRIQIEGVIVKVVKDKFSPK